MKQSYIEKHTRDWNLEDKYEKVELWLYFDEVYWDKFYAIKVNDEIKESIPIAESELAYKIVDILNKCL